MGNCNSEGEKNSNGSEIDLRLRINSNLNPQMVDNLHHKCDFPFQQKKSLKKMSEIKLKRGLENLKLKSCKMIGKNENSVNSPGIYISGNKLLFSSQEDNWSINGSNGPIFDAQRDKFHQKIEIVEESGSENLSSSSQNEKTSKVDDDFELFLKEKELLFEEEHRGNRIVTELDDEDEEDDLTYENEFYYKTERKEVNLDEKKSGKVVFFTRRTHKKSFDFNSIKVHLDTFNDEN